MRKIRYSDILSQSDKAEMLNVFDDIISFIQEIKPTLDNLIVHNNQTSIVNNNIYKVPEATEIASSEITFILDGLFPKIDNVINYLKRFMLNSGFMSKSILNILLSIRKGIQANINLNEILPELNEVINKLENENNQINKLEEIEKILLSIKTDVTSIMMTLHIQNISAKELIEIKHFLDSIQGQASKILENIESFELDSIIEDDEDTNSDNSNYLNDMDELLNTLADNDDKNILDEELKNLQSEK
jgi:hypothetical protein